MSRPKPLQPGDRVALICPSGCLPQEKLEPALKAVRAFDLEPVVYDSCTARYGYLAGDDALRARDVHSAFADPAIAGVFCMRGGYGSQRILPLLDLDAIGRNWKLFLGYSDATALHIAFNNRGFASLHTPMPSTEWCREDFDDFTREGLSALLFGQSPRLTNPSGDPLTCLMPGTAQGALVGGNLSLVAASLGTPWEIDCTDKILFLEDVNEDIYRIDRMLAQLRNAGVFDRCAGVLLGAFSNCEAKNPNRSLTLEQVFNDLLLPAKKPVLSGLRCGHCLPTLSLMLGARIFMNAGGCELQFLEE